MRLRLKIERGFNPNQRRDSDGKWSADLLGLADRITLADGEVLESSGRLDPKGDDDADVLWAVTSSSRGKQARISVQPHHAVGEWNGDDEYTTRLNRRQARHLHDDLDTGAKQGKKVAAAVDKLWAAGEQPSGDVLTDVVASGAVSDLRWSIDLTDDDPTSFLTTITVGNDDQADGVRLDPKDLRKLLAALTALDDDLARHLPGLHDQSSHGRGLDFDAFTTLYGEVYDEANIGDYSVIVFTAGDFGIFIDRGDTREPFFDGLEASSARDLSEALEWASTVDIPESAERNPDTGLVGSRAVTDELTVGYDHAGDVSIITSDDRIDLGAQEAYQMADGLWAMADRADELDDMEDEEPVERAQISRVQSADGGPKAAPAGGQFAPGGGRVAGKGKKPTKGRTSARRPTPRRPAAPAGPMAFDGTKGTGYGIKGGDPRVRSLQSVLNRLGLTDANGQKLAVDGKFGPRTTAAVKKLQKELGLTADGKVTPELLKKATELKALPGKSGVAEKKPARTSGKPVAKPRVKRSRDDILEHLRGKLMQRIQRSATLFDRAYPLDDIHIQRSGDGRTVEAYAAVFDTPYEVRDQHGHYMEVIERSAFDRTLKSGAGQKAMCLYNHGYTIHGTPDALSSVPLGTPQEIRPDGRGLLTVTRYNKSALADSVLEAIRAGDIRSQSFRGRIVRSSPTRLPRQRPGSALPNVYRHELGLTDYGPTPTPVNDGAQIMAVRSVDMLLNDFAALDDDGRYELLRHLGIDLDADDTEDECDDAPNEGDDTATSDNSEPGAEDPHTERSDVHSGRLAIARARLRAELISKGVIRRAEAA